RWTVPARRGGGMDPLAVKLAMDQAAVHMRAGRGPAIIEAEVYRFFHQSGPFPGSAFGYRTKEEEAAWRSRDPLDRVAVEMIERGHLDQGQVDALRLRAQEAMARIADALTEPAGNRRRIRDELWPSPAFRHEGVWGDLPELAGKRFVERDAFNGRVEERKFIDVVADVMHRRMETDERIVVLGEDIHRLKGGING